MERQVRMLMRLFSRVIVVLLLNFFHEHSLDDFQGGGHSGEVGVDLVGLTEVVSSSEDAKIFSDKEAIGGVYEGYSVDQGRLSV